MKKSLTILLVAGLLLLAAFGIQQARRRAAAQARLDELQRQLASTTAEAAARQAVDEREQSRLGELNLKLADKTRELSRRQTNASTSAAPATSAGIEEQSRFKAVHKDPEMKEAMSRQGQQVVQRNVRQLLTPQLVRQLRLGTNQTAVLRDLLTRKGTLGFEFMMPLMSGDVDGAALAQAGIQTKAAMTELETQMKAVLGEEGYRTFEAHEKAQPDREKLHQFATLQNETGEPLTAAQQENLLAAITEERNRFRFTTDYSDTSKIDYEHFQDFYAEDKLNLYFDELGRLNERLVERAGAILSPEQAGRFQELLKDQMLKGKYVAKTTNALIGKRAAQ